MKKLFLFSVITMVAIAVNAQIEANKNVVNSDTTIQKQYTCPMHPNVLGDKPGTCPDCGMALVEKKMEKVKTYTCPMHSDVISDKPGTCPKCGMNLVEKKVELAKYSCPMHPDVISDKPGKCPKCGMNLVEQKSSGKNKKKKSCCM